MIKPKLLLLSLCFASSFAFSQVRVVTVAPLGLVNKFRVKYEQQMNSKDISLGTYLNIYYGYFEGARVDPFIRFYFFSENLRGLYLQLKVMGGFFQSNLEYKYYGTVDTLSTKKMTGFSSFGGGPAVGYQWYINDKIPVDAFVGFNLSKMSAPTSILRDNQKYELYDDALWYVTGPGSIFHFHVGIGFKF